MPKKVKRAKKRASTEKISINIKNILRTSTERVKRRQAPDIIRPLGKRPIEASAFDNQYRLQNPSVTYASTPLANMASLRDLIQAPSAPQVTGQLALRQQPPATNPNQIVPQLRPSQRAISPAFNVELRAITPVRNPYTSPQLLWEASHRPVAQPQFQPGPIIGRSLESIAENTSQRLVAEQMDQDSRNYARLPTPPRSATVRPLPSQSSALPGVAPELAKKRAPIIKRAPISPDSSPETSPKREAPAPAPQPAVGLRGKAKLVRPAMAIDA